MRSFHDTLTLPNGVVLKNRLAIAPLTVCLSDPHGYVTPQEVDYYASRTGEVGLYITGCSYIQPNGRGWLGEEAIYDDSFIPGLSKMASAIKRNGTKAIMQIFHAGRMAEEDAIFGYDLVSAGDVAAPLKGYRTPRPLTDAEIAEVIANFKGAAVRAMKAGFDGVEIHGANNYLIHQFFSPHSNNRTDCWGRLAGKPRRLSPGRRRRRLRRSPGNGSQRFYRRLSPVSARAMDAGHCPRRYAVPRRQARLFEAGLPAYFPKPYYQHGYRAGILRQADSRAY